MAASQADHAAVSQDLVTRVGTAAGHVARIHQQYATRAETETSASAREGLASWARAAAEQAIDRQGLTIQDYNTVLAAAETDEDLEQRLLDAVREVL